MKMGEECPKDWYTEEAIRGWLKREGVPHARDLPRFLAEHFQKALEKGWQLRSSALRAVRAEALEEAAKVAHEWPLDVDRCVKALKIGANAKDWAVAFAYVADEIAAAIRALASGEKL